MQFDILPQLAQSTADHYSRGCNVPCRVINTSGKTIHLSIQDYKAVTICDLAGSIRTAAHSCESTETSTICSNTHLYGCYQAERFGGRYVYFCPLGLTHWASPIIVEGNVVGALVAGPVQMVDPDEFLIDEIVMKNGIRTDLLPKLQQQIKQVPVMSTEQVNSMCEVLYLAARRLSDASFDQQNIQKKHDGPPGDLHEQLNFLQNFTQAAETSLTYPIEKERQLLELVEAGDKSGSQTVLNEILGHVIFSRNGSLQAVQARISELIVLLSRAAIKGGADIQQIFGLNYACLNKIHSLHNMDDIADWLSGIMARFTDQVFNLTGVKHADAIYRAIDHVKKNYMKKISLDDTAALVFLSPTYFSRLFKEETGVNFNAFLNQVRIDAARKLLLNEKMPLNDISMLVGFDGHNYFSKVFKSKTGVTPGKFRESRGKCLATRQQQIP